MFFLGSPRIEKDNRPVDLKRRKTAALLPYLALADRPVLREQLAGIFWPENDTSSAFAYLRHTLWELGSALGQEALQVNRDTVALSDHVWVDVHRFSFLAGQWKANHQPADLEELIALYQADFLDRFFLRDAPDFDQWQQETSAVLRQDFSDALGSGSAAYLASGDTERALLHGRRWLRLDPLNEAAHRLVMRAELNAGRRAAALRQYEECARLLQAELGVQPAPATLVLLEEIRAAPAEPDPVGTPAASARVPWRLFSPSSSSSARPASLPHDPVPFIGRRMELGEIAYRLQDPDCRLLTLLGPGGIGKTRLGLHAARELANNYPGGVHFLACAPLDSPQDFLPALAAVLPQRRDGPEGSLMQRICASFSDDPALLVLDNMEHLTACGEDLQTILEASPGLNILVTSRERLNVPAEWCLEISGMSYPLSEDPGFEEYSAVQLFLHTARRVKTGFQLTPADRAAIAQICRLVEGMPLGVELAASWIRLLPAPDILREIESSLDFLSTSQRGIPERHRSLRAVYDSSVEMLSTAERIAFVRLASLPGGFRRDVALAAGIGLPLLSALADKSLLRSLPDGRYEIHEVLRKYATERL